MSSRYDNRQDQIEAGRGESAPGSRLISPWEDDTGVRTFLRERAAAHCEFYGSGKVALRDGLDILATHMDPGRTNVVLPAYVPSALLEPIKDAGYEPRLYRITPELRPDLGHVESLIDDGTLALVSVNYFGFPQRGHSALVGHAADHDVALIEDNAHSALSMTPEGILLGTRGDIGFTSFRKTLPVPDGAALFVWREGLRDGPFPRGGVRKRPTARDFRSALWRVAKSVYPGWSWRKGNPSGGGARSEGRDLFGRDPRAVYERAPGRMSYLSAITLDHIRPGAVIAEKRRNYELRRAAVTEVPSARPVLGELPPGTCPHSCPVITEDVDALADSLALPRRALHRWPPLPIEVLTDDSFETSQYFAERLIPVPV